MSFKSKTKKKKYLKHFDNNNNNKTLEIITKIEFEVKNS